MFQPSWFTDLQSLATLVVVVVAVGLALWGRARDRDGAWWQAVAIGGPLFGFIWIHATYLDVAFGVLVGLIAIIGADSAIGHVAAIVVGVVAAFTVHAMPGGIATLLALGACLMAVITGVRAGRFLRRLVDQSRGEHGRALTWDLVRALGWGAAAAAVAASHLLA